MPAQTLTDPPSTRKDSDDRPVPSTDVFYDITQLAGWLNITERHIRRLVAERRIPHHKMGGRVRFRRAEIEQWLDDNGRGQQRDESA